MTGFDWATLSAAKNARPDAVPEMIRHTLRVLEDLLEDADHICTFTLADGPYTDDAATSVNALLPNGCRVSRLEPVASWSEQLRQVLPGLFVPARQPAAWAEHGAPRQLVEALAEWALALMGQLWPESARSWTVEVETDHWYEAVWFDLAVRADNRISLLHLGITD